ncbi:unnamed protein product [Trypanosoma congolense IL3000]|uniref:Gamma-soluble NSF attachment protein n=1 Tax=Trypanosoma congolense (strain IL3000) TaxID=1068625 RepID=F9WJC7_TRYCI|nr:unnamed protein product [Trypanosoma congolense IL3000]
MSSNVSEADKLMLSAKKHLKTGFFKRKPDWGSAADDYERASEIYMRAREIEKTREAIIGACEALDKNNCVCSASRLMIKLATFLAEEAQKGSDGKCVDEELIDNAVEVYCGAGRYFAVEGKYDRQADVLVKAAELINPTKSISDSAGGAAYADESNQTKLQRVYMLLEEAVNLLESNSEENSCYATRLPNIYHMWLLARLRSGDIIGAVAVLERQLGISTVSSSHGVNKGKDKAFRVFVSLNQPHNAAKAALEMIVLCLSLGDVVLARDKMNALRDVPGFGGSKEESTAFALLDAFEERDVEKLQETLKSSTLLFLTNDITRIAKKLVITSTEVKADGCGQGPCNDDDEDIR